MVVSRLGVPVALRVAPVPINELAAEVVTIGAAGLLVDGGVPSTRKNIGTLTVIWPLAPANTESSPAQLVCQTPSIELAHCTLAMLLDARLVHTSTPFALNDWITGACAHAALRDVNQTAHTTSKNFIRRIGFLTGLAASLSQVPFLFKPIKEGGDGFQGNAGQL